MRLERLIERFGTLPAIETENLLAGISDPNPIKVQMSRWTKTGKLIQLKRGIYIFSEPYRKTKIFEPYLAAILKRPSYLSLEKALEYHHLIPEGVGVFTSVTTKRPEKLTTPLGTFDYRHIHSSLFWGYESFLIQNQTAFMAHPEKALLDLIYLKHIHLTMDYLKEMRLQNLETIDSQRLNEYAGRFEKPWISQAVKIFQEFLKSQYGKEKQL